MGPGARRGRGDRRQAGRRRAAAYLAKYSTKSTDEHGVLDHRLRAGVPDALELPTHLRRLVESAWRLGGEPGGQELRLRAWAHTAGYRGHCLTKSRRFSTTFGALRAIRQEWRVAEKRVGADRPTTREPTATPTGSSASGRSSAWATRQRAMPGWPSRSPRRNDWPDASLRGATGCFAGGEVRHAVLADDLISIPEAARASAFTPTPSTGCAAPGSFLRLSRSVLGGGCRFRVLSAISIRRQEKILEASGKSEDERSR